MVDNFIETSFEKTGFSFLCRYCLQIASWLGVDLVFASPDQGWDFVWLEPVQVLCVLSQSEFIYASVLLCLEDAKEASFYSLYPKA